MLCCVSQFPPQDRMTYLQLLIFLPTLSCQPSHITYSWSELPHSNSFSLKSSQDLMPIHAWSHCPNSGQVYSTILIENSLSSWLYRKLMRIPTQFCFHLAHVDPNIIVQKSSCLLMSIIESSFWGNWSPDVSSQVSQESRY